MNKKKLITTFGSLALVGAIGVGATLAYLTDQTTTVENTFTISDNVSITLDELNVDQNDRVAANNYVDVVPGVQLFKDPTVTINKKDLDQYVFMAVQKSNDVTINDFDNAWTQYTLDDELASNIVVYYYEYTAGTTQDAYADGAIYTDGDKEINLQFDTGTFQLPALFHHVTPGDKDYPESGNPAPTYQPILIRAATIQKDGISDVNAAYNEIKTGLIDFD